MIRRRQAVSWAAQVDQNTNDPVRIQKRKALAPLASAPRRRECTCSTNPYNCPQGQALVSAIHERKGNQ